MNWWKDLRGKTGLEEPLKDKTAFKIGGPARFLIEPKDVFDLRALLSLAKKHKIPLLVLGAGSNVLVSDKGVRKIVVRLNLPFFKGIVKEGNCLAAGSGVMLSGLIREAGRLGLSGLEFLAGIPGTLGGALRMNAGAWGENIGGLVETVSVMGYNGRVRVLRRDEIRFAYRASSLQRYIILSASLRLAKKRNEEIRGSIMKYLRARRLTQDTAFPNAGCIFKNPPGNSAGRLIDLCGLKGTKAGGAYISSRHANFILNRKHASAKDVVTLMGLIKRKVKQRFNIKLEPEIKIWQ
jgi:UDP-N-acetylmuramate dehydrogenase